HPGMDAVNARTGRAHTLLDYYPDGDEPPMMPAVRPGLTRNPRTKYVGTEAQSAEATLPQNSYMARPERLSDGLGYGPNDPINIGDEKWPAKNLWMPADLAQTWRKYYADPNDRSIWSDINAATRTTQLAFGAPIH